MHVQAAEFELLLRVPGIGVRSARHIVQARRHRALTLADLGKLGVAVRRARHFVITADRNPAVHELDGAGLRAQLVGPRQLSLFP